jgi:hypothetical protein
MNGYIGEICEYQAGVKMCLLEFFVEQTVVFV